MVKKNPRRKGGKNKKRTEHASTWEGQTEGQRGVAKGRRRWKKLRKKSERRTGKMSRKYHSTKRKRPGRLFSDDATTVAVMSWLKED
jgi:hypothetical protein